ncbi:hypothetical protein D3C84_506880 [compost metagenome]
MNQSPEFKPYPLASAPVYSRWLVSGVVLLALMSAGSEFVVLLIEPQLAAVAVVAVLLSWTLALLLRVLYYRLNRHNAQSYAEAAERVRQAWWARHRQKAALVEAVLLGAGCTRPEHRQALFNPDCQPPRPEETPEGPTIRLRQVFGSDVAERERQLAILLALHWQVQRKEFTALAPLKCYWQGSLAAWQAFVQEMALHSPQLHLPEQPEPWQGIASLNAIIDQLQGAPEEARILCGGCHCSPARQEHPMANGEAAVLWVFGPRGGVRFTRGEWFSADAESLTTVAARALQQSELQAPVPTCVSFSQPHLSDLAAIGWNTSQNLQDENFGALASLEAMVVQTLAAWHAQQHAEPCAWLANDPHHTLALGIVEADDSSN